jgi:hypothetical protein
MRLSLACLLALAGTAFARDGKIQWTKLDQALATAGRTGQPICVYVAVNPNGSS